MNITLSGLITRKTVLELLSIALSLGIPFFLLVLIVNGSHMQFGDYFYMVESLFTKDGVLTLSGLLKHGNEHLVFFPKLLFLANIYLFEGSNISLGIAVWMIGATTAGILLWNTVSWSHSRDTCQIGLIWAALVFLFPLSAAHNFLLAMSGSSWILANFFSVCAIVSLAHSRSLLAGIFGAASTFSYGTGLAVWPALFFVKLFTKRYAWRDALLLAIGIVSVMAERLTYTTLDKHPPLETNLLLILRSISITVGAIFSSNVDVAMLIGAGGLALAGFSLFRFWLSDAKKISGVIMVGLISYCLVIFVLFGISRAGFGDGMFLSSRYMAVTGLFYFAIFALSLMELGNKSMIPAIIASAIILNLSVAIKIIKEVKDTARFHQDLGSLAAKLDLASGLIFEYGPNTSAVLKATNQYPFSKLGDDLACGMIGKRIDSLLHVTQPGVLGWIDSVNHEPDSQAVKISGWIHSKRPIDCVLIINEFSDVIGAAVVGWDREDVRSTIKGSRRDIGFQGVARATSSKEFRTVARLKGDVDFFEIQHSM